ncbi:MAG: hypothetical protein SPK09_06395 [Porphyromonas sp.]|nr:hypothetical protein [Porphyromonas sp.]
MIKQFQSIGRLARYALIALLGLSACDKSEPVKPKNEIENKLHENPSKVIYTLTEAELAEGSTFDYSAIAGIAATTKTQQIVWEQKGDASWGYAEGSAESFVVKAQATSPNTVYKLDIAYFSPSGQPMNTQFIHNGQDKIHQHFFSLYLDKRLVRDSSLIPYSYLYADRLEGKLVGKENPLGFEGYFAFPKAFGQVAIKAELLHAYKSKYLEDGSLSPFYAPERKLRTISDMDISVELLFREEGGSAGDMPATPEAQPVSPETPGAAPDMNTTKLGGSNTTRIRKIKLELLEGHMHGPEFHYVPGSQDFRYKNLAVEQEMILEWREGQWQITSGDIKRLLMMQAKVYDEGQLGMPVYGLFTSLYDASGQDITGEFAGAQHQIFYRPEHIRSFSTGEAVQERAEEFLSYTYWDTHQWNESAHSKRTHRIGDKDPFGHKGYFVFNKGDRQFMLDLQLWATPQGKTGSDGKLSPAHTPSTHITQTGSKLLSVQIPCYTWLDRDATGNLDPDGSVEDLSAKHQPIVRALLKLLGIDFVALATDMDLRLSGEIDESTGRWF